MIYFYFNRRQLTTITLGVFFDVIVEEFEALCGSKIQESDDDTDSEWEEADN